MIPQSTFSLASLIHLDAIERELGDKTEFHLAGEYAVENSNTRKLAIYSLLLYSRLFASIRGSKLRS